MLKITRQLTFFIAITTFSLFIPLDLGLLFFSILIFMVAGFRYLLAYWMIDLLTSLPTDVQYIGMMGSLIQTATNPVHSQMVIPSLPTFSLPIWANGLLIVGQFMVFIAFGIIPITFEIYLAKRITRRIPSYIKKGSPR